MDTAITVSPLVEMFQLQSRLFSNATEGYDGANDHARNGIGNHAAWLTGHLVSTRYMLAGLVGVESSEPHPDLFGMGKGLQEDATYPTVEALRKDWEAISQKVVSGLAALTTDQLNAASPIQVPMPGKTLGATLAFFAHHEAYHIGQLGLLRRNFGMEAMKYS